MSDSIKIAIASCCNRQGFARAGKDYQKDTWGEMAKQSPDYLFLLGDNIYMDYGYWPATDEFNGWTKKISPSDFRTVMEDKYYRQFEQPYFKQLVTEMKAKSAFYGVWDDHDFAWNGAYGAEMDNDPEQAQKKRYALELFRRYMGAPEDQDGIYQYIDTPQARVFFLDCRYFAQGKPAWFQPKTNRELLGEQQHQFISDNIQHDKPFTIFCSGMTLFDGGENWNQFTYGQKTEIHRLAEHINKNPNHQVLFLSGDIHKNKYYPKGTDSKGNTRPCHEIICSGIAINYLGLPVPNDDVHNWGMLEIDADKVAFRLYNKRGLQIEQMIAATG